MMRALALALVLLAPAPALAEDDTLLVSLVAEATYRGRDHAAILHTLGRRARRQGIPLAVMFRRYCSVWKKDRIPARVLRDLENPREVAKIFRTIDRYRAGTLPDPCRGRTVHFGAPYGVDAENGRKWTAVDCGDTANVYYGP